jgi:hypothetical protein
MEGIALRASVELPWRSDTCLRIWASATVAISWLRRTRISHRWTQIYTDEGKIILEFIETFARLWNIRSVK